MAQFAFHLTGSGGALLVESTASSLEEIGRDLVRNRFITLTLLEEGGNWLPEPKEILVPLHRVKLISLQA